MKNFRHIVIYAALVLLIPLFNPAHAADVTYSLGDSIQDFTFSTYDGREITFSEVLKEKEAVLINIWASWCGPCRSEFPHMQKAYEAYQDKVEVIALSSEPTDTAEVLADFAHEYGLTFLIGQDPVDFLSALQIGSIPTTLMVDRFGTICLIETGAQPSVESFKRMFDAFIGDDYTESVLYHGLPAAKPNVPAASEAELATALEATASNPSNDRIWPMLPAEKDGRSVLTSSNGSQASSEATVSTVLKAKAGNAIVVTFKTSTEQVFDLFRISVNGQVAKSFSGEHDWTDYAIPVEADGEYIVGLSYVKDHQGDVGEDAVWIDRIAVVEDAVAALEANPAYPPASESITLMAKDAREISIEDTSGLLQATFGEARYFITNSDQASVAAQLTAAYDPETCFFYTSKGQLRPLTDCMQENEYLLQVNVDSADTTGYACTSVLLYLDNTGADYVTLLLFKDEENVDLLCHYNELGSWAYADEASLQTEESALPDQVEYEINCVDQYGNPVAGAMIQVCDETTCQVFVTDENGQCTFTAAPKAWEVHVLMAPQGYSVGEKNVIQTPVAGGEINFTLIKE